MLSVALCYAECSYSADIMMFSIVMLSAVMLSVFMLIVVAPIKRIAVCQPPLFFNLANSMLKYGALTTDNRTRACNIKPFTSAIDIMNNAVL
jgi:hypothetical protein